MAGVEHRTFSGAEALRRGQPVLYVTERAVFRLIDAGGGKPGLELVELAPGIELERDVLARMAFQPRHAANVATMEAALFNEASLGLRERILATPLADRFDLDTAHNTLYIDFSGLSINAPAQIDAIERSVEARLGGQQARRRRGQLRSLQHRTGAGRPLCRDGEPSLTATVTAASPATAPVAF